MKKFPLDGDNEGKEASLFVVPINVRGEQKTQSFTKLTPQNIVQTIHFYINESECINLF